MRGTGTLRLEDKEYALAMDGLVFSSAQVDHGENRVTRVGSKTAKTVQDYQPRLVHGTLDDGRELSLLDAHLSVGFPLFGEPAQSLEGRQILWDAHVDKRQTQVAGVRWKIGLGAAPWPSDAPSTTGSVGTLHAWGGRRSPGMEFRLTPPLPLQVAVHQVIERTTSLFSVARGRRVDAFHRQVLLEGRWCDYGIATDADELTSRPGLHELLGGRVLTLDTMMHWFHVAQRLGHIPYVASAHGQLLELHAAAILTAFEGCHRRLHPGATRLAGYSKGELKRAAKAAAEAAVNSLTTARPVTPGGDRQATPLKDLYFEALGHVQDPTYALRLQELLAPVHDIAPDLFAPDFATWITMAKALRNQESHALDSLDPIDESRISDYYVIQASGQWALRLRLLLEVLDADVLKNALRDSNRYHFAVANVAASVKLGRE